MKCVFDFQKRECVCVRAFGVVASILHFIQYLVGDFAFAHVVKQFFFVCVHFYVAVANIVLYVFVLAFLLNALCGWYG